VSSVQLTVVNEVEAEVVCGLLRSAGIKCGHRPAQVATGSLEALAVGGPHEVLVDEADLEAARTLIEQERTTDSER
jgi:hypothetical protein